VISICDIFPAFSENGQWHILTFVAQFKYPWHVIRNDLGNDEDIKRELKALFTIYFLVDLIDVLMLSRDVFLVSFWFSIVDYIYISDSTTV